MLHVLDDARRPLRLLQLIPLVAAVIDLLHPAVMILVPALAGRAERPGIARAATSVDASPLAFAFVGAHANKRLPIATHAAGNTARIVRRRRCGLLSDLNCGRPSVAGWDYHIGGLLRHQAPHVGRMLLNQWDHVMATGVVHIPSAAVAPAVGHRNPVHPSGCGPAGRGGGINELVRLGKQLAPLVVRNAELRQYHRHIQDVPVCVVRADRPLVVFHHLTPRRVVAEKMVRIYVACREIDAGQGVVFDEIGAHSPSPSPWVGAEVRALSPRLVEALKAHREQMLGVQRLHVRCHLGDPGLEHRAACVSLQARLVDELPREDDRIVLVGEARVRVHTRDHLGDKVSVHPLAVSVREEVVLGGGGIGPLHVLGLPAVLVPFVDEGQNQLDTNRAGLVQNIVQTSEHVLVELSRVWLQRLPVLSAIRKGPGAHDELSLVYHVLQDVVHFVLLAGRGPFHQVVAVASRKEQRLVVEDEPSPAYLNKALRTEGGLRCWEKSTRG
mmetsp:Transcript_10016/g.36628  ORF Transcript_10016/g.36628 Transcript_10016/m.36628 type:complete len:499 (+) Transcript_10016:1746-3242(+)